MTEGHRQAVLWSGLSVFLVVVALFTRPLLPVGETRYLSVAWEMWSGGNFLVPHLNGEAYSHKPPLLFWLIHAGWAVFGVGEWWPRLVSPAFALATLFVTACLGRLLWPDGRAGRAAPLVLLASAFWAVTTTLTMFDMMLAFATVITLAGVVRAWRFGRPLDWTLVAFGIAAGILTKGPVMLVHVLPVGLLAPVWGPCLAPEPGNPNSGVARRSAIAWSLRFGAAVGAGLALALVWAIPAGIAGGKAYSDAIFWSQSAGRMLESFAHERSWWWYVAGLVPLLLPLALWPDAWRSLRHAPRAMADGGFRFCLSWFVPTLIGLSFISGKQFHYLLPAMPALALGIAFLLETQAARPDGGAAAGSGRYLGMPGAIVAAIGVAVLFAIPQSVLTKVSGTTLPVANAWGAVIAAAGIAVAAVPLQTMAGRLAALAALSVVTVAAAHAAAMPVLRESFNLEPLAQRLETWESAGRPLAHYGKYHGQFHFLGRLRRPFAIIGDQEVARWVADNPNGLIISYNDRTPPQAAPAASQNYRRKIIGVWDAAAVRADLSIVQRP
ncbi:MAG: glycosyltransferase family 39 protein [Rhodospirillales bacterium]|jgi:4-amino-4-deoxy-L-arabinose transferase-like glycosyltransferase|nr:glycosyltransferase family 39 protein [Rhodospirillales bacterium]MDP6804624.1 glycosyltransferase family 39 protein [Rhodospirillales bacterium]